MGTVRRRQDNEPLEGTVPSPTAVGIAPRPVVVIRDVRIPTEDRHVSLSADLYRPAGSARVPVLVTVQPYRKDISGIPLEPVFRWFVENGYACLLVELRGTGASDGVARSKMDPGEADDAVAAIEWAAVQSWCDGTVGMWGASSAGFTTLLAACRRPLHLKAIIPMICPLDPGNDAFHHDGARVDLHQLVLWGGQMLVEQLIPPLTGADPASRRRWHHRLHRTEPFVVDLARYGPRDATLRTRALDPSVITIPTLCVGGWRDLYADATVRLYESVQGPKQLLMGPWTHTMPQDAPHQPLDFLPMMLRWWDHWLRGADNGVPDDLGAYVHVQGATPGWRRYPAWPPAKDGRTFTAHPDRTLRDADSAPVPHVTPIATLRSDPTVGALSGLWGIPNAGAGAALDQHDDDLRAVAVTSAPLAAALLVCGRPEVTVIVQDAAERLVVKLTDVDPAGRSTLITAGVICPAIDCDPEVRIALRATTYRIEAGHRLRVVVCDADFPRLVPLPKPQTIRVLGLTLVVPGPDEFEGAAADLPIAHTVDPGGTVWMITRDPVHDGIEVTIGGRTAEVRTVEGHLFSKDTDVCARVRRASPDAATITGQHSATVRMATGELITATATVRCDQASMWARGELTIDGLVTFDRTWHATLDDRDR